MASTLKKVEKHVCPLPTATGVINNILKRKIIWTAWKKMSLEGRKAWSLQAEQLLRNPVFVSLCGRVIDGEKTNGELVKNLLESGVRYAEDYEQMKDIRMTINGAELIREMAEEMLYQEQPETHDDVNAAA